MIFILARMRRRRGGREGERKGRNEGATREGEDGEQLRRISLGTRLRRKRHRQRDRKGDIRPERESDRVRGGGGHNWQLYCEVLQ